jgi:hypothetical protein
VDEAFGRSGRCSNGIDYLYLELKQHGGGFLFAEALGAGLGFMYVVL